MESQLSCFKSWKMMLWKCCTQYARKFGKLSSGHRTAKGQFLFQSQKRTMPKNVQTSLIALISHASKVMLKILQARLQQYMNWEFPDLEKAEEPEIKLPTSTGSWTKQEISRKTSISALLTMPKPLTVWITINCGKFWEMGIPDHLTCLLRNLYAGEKAAVRTGHGTTDWFQTGKGVRQSCILSPCLFNLYAEYIMRNTGLEEAQAGIKIAGRNISHLRYADDTILMAEREEELKSLLMKVRGEWKSWLKVQYSEN